MKKTKLIKNKKRLDGRGLDELRPVEAKVGVIPNATGSASFSMGKTKVIAAVYGPLELHPRKLREPTECVLVTRYAMLPFSTDERVRPGISRRSTEISLIIRQALTPVLYLEEFPDIGIKLYIDVIQADASTRCAAINAASLALADAGIAMRDLVSSVSVGVVEGQMVVDVAGEEDTEGEVDLPLAYVQKSNAISMVQMDGMLDFKDFKTAVSKGIKACKEIRKIQEKALLAKYGVEKPVGEFEEESI